MRESGARNLVAVVGMVLSIGATGCYAAEGAGWTYGGATGPAKWGSLEKGYAGCKLGQTQSPIDIPDAKARKGDLPSLLFNYKPSPLKIIDDGHTIQVNYAPGSFVTVAGTRYELVQFHFHKPSEEKIDGKGHDMDAHLVHQGPGGKLAVIAVLLDTGKENRADQDALGQPAERERQGDRRRRGEDQRRGSCSRRTRVTTPLPDQ